MRALTIALAGLLVGCASSEKELRQAWEQALKDRENGGEQTQSEQDDGAAGQRAQQQEGIEAYLSQIHGRLAEGVGAMSVSALLSAICDGEADRISNDTGAVYHCVPEPSQELGSTPLTVEVSSAGVVSLAADDLSEAAARQLVRHGIEIVRSLCQVAPVDRVQDPNEDFHSCTTTDAVTVVVGRFKLSDATTQWRFSLAMLAPG